ncbi:bifunctional 3-(3-hydroxy-phenyl)propionate/3-hydroxycinnamic acid hydroxylase [Janibacter melonis]|uniref:bifunctional 3-(3-hydroxy-phenyl)propionate/3-hydroxycinnamic acid hydroxylase n=1 Tax=Janibacter melonis TaxID=262209 RepID=UPI001748C9F6|nr:bifunctional 3-(3-hydroxy-phenyl)propionate/3-hydroxycinnamic acid hydroxylase [Janibacter melonis]
MQTEVVIAGAGPCGLALANLLGQYGRKVVVLEAREDLIDYPRGVGLDDESMRTIQTMGLTDEVIPYTIPHHVMRLVNGKGEVMVTNDPTGEPFGWPRKFGFIQPLVDRELYRGAQRYDDVDVRFGHTVTGHVDHGDHVAVTVSVAQDDGTVREETITAQYLVGCEGGSSRTRKAMDVDFVGESPSTRWVVIDVRNDPLGVPNVYLGADPARPYVSIGLPHAIRRWEFMLFDDEPSERVEDDEFVAELLREHVPDSASLDVIRRRVFTHHGRIASHFREGRVLVAGDAAHLMPVWMGQGWNSGMRDATNLSWKLASVLSGQADEAILDTYESERRDHAKAMIDLSMTLGNVIKPTNRLVCGARDVASRVLNLSPQVKDYFADMKFKPMPFYAEGVVVEPDTLRPGRQERTRRSRFMTVRNAVSKVTPVGTQFIQPRVRTADVHEARLDDVVGPWWTVAAWGNDPARLFTPQEREQLRHMGAQLVCFTSESQRAWAQDDLADPETLVVGCVDGALKSWFDTRAMGVVFLRPDRFVAAACLAQEAGTALASLRTAMHATPVASGAAVEAAEIAGDVTDAGGVTPSLEVVA